MHVIPFEMSAVQALCKEHLSMPGGPYQFFPVPGSTEWFRDCSLIETYPRLASSGTIRLLPSRSKLRRSYIVGSRAYRKSCYNAYRKSRNTAQRRPLHPTATEMLQYAVPPTAPQFIPPPSSLFNADAPSRPLSTGPSFERRDYDQAISRPVSTSQQRSYTPQLYRTASEESATSWQQQNLPALSTLASLAASVSAARTGGERYVWFVDLIWKGQSEIKRIENQ